MSFDLQATQHCRPAMQPARTLNGEVNQGSPWSPSLKSTVAQYCGNGLYCLTESLTQAVLQTCTALGSPQNKGRLLVTT